MPFNGSGTFNRVMDWTNDRDAAIKIRADRHDQNDDDIAAGLSQTITRDGQSQVTANIPFNGRKIINLAQPTDPQDGATKKYVDDKTGATDPIIIAGSDDKGRLRFTGSQSDATATSLKPLGIEFASSDLFFGVRRYTSAAAPNRWVWNPNADGSGTDMMTLWENGPLTLSAIGSTTALIQTPLPGFAFFRRRDAAAGRWYFNITDDGLSTGANNISVANINDAGQITGTSIMALRDLSPSMAVFSAALGQARGFWLGTANTFALGALTAEGNPAALYASFTASGLFFGPAGTGSGFCMVDTGAGKVISLQSNSYFTFGNSDGNLTWVSNSIARWTSRWSDSGFVNNGPALKPGGGVWEDSSDERIKTVVGAYESGLDQIKALQPVRYTFKGNDTDDEPINQPPPPTGTDVTTLPAEEDPEVPYWNSPHRQAALAGTEFVGLVAQDTEEAMPELVKQRPGYIDGTEVTDLRNLDTTPLIYACINAIKTLDQRLAAVEGA